MPITLIETIGGANSNTWATLTEFQDFCDLRLDGSAHDLADADTRSRALAQACRRLNQENWQGEKASEAQILAHPRNYLPKVDPVGGYDAHWGYAYGWTDRQYYLATEIAQPVKDAQMLLALYYLKGWVEGEQNAVEEFAESGGVRVKFRATAPVGGLPDEVNQLIAALIRGNRLVRA
jgi:hypothetical protein